MIRPGKTRIAEWEATLSETSRVHLRCAAERIASARQNGRGVTVVTGSGPNIHEGVTTLIAELIRKGVVDGVLTSSAVVAHEMAGTLDRVRRIKAANHPQLNVFREMLPRGGVFEITELSEPDRAMVRAEMDQGWDLYDQAEALDGLVIQALHRLEAERQFFLDAPLQFRHQQRVQANFQEGGVRRQ